MPDKTAALSTPRKPIFLISSLILILISILLTLCLAEGVLHLVNYPKQSWSPWIEDPHTDFRYASLLDQRMVTEEYDVSVVTNEAGFRDDPIGPKKGKRVLLLGDSFTFGYGVDRPYLFADLLEKELNVEILNAASGGFDLVHQVQWMKYYGSQYAPDLVVYMLYLGNDLVGNWKWENDFGNIKASHRPTVRSHRDIKLLTLLKILRHRLMFYIPQSRKWRLPEEYLALMANDLSPEALKDYESSKTLLAELAEEVKKTGAPFVVVLVPYKTLVQTSDQEELKNKISDFHIRYDLDRPGKEITGWLEIKNVAILDLTSGLRQISKNETAALFYLKDGHLTRDGHEVVSTLMADTLRQELNHAS